MLILKNMESRKEITQKEKKRRNGIKGWPMRESTTQHVLKVM
jgi:hypothetical protein